MKYSTNRVTASSPADVMIAGSGVPAEAPTAASCDCGRPWAGAGEYELVNCGSGQDFPGWLAVLYGGDGRAIAPGCTDGNSQGILGSCPRIVAAVNIFTTPATLNCTLHNVQQMGDVISINVQTLDGQPRCVAMGNMVYWRFPDPVSVTRPSGPWSHWPPPSKK